MNTARNMIGLAGLRAAARGPNGVSRRVAFSTTSKLRLKESSSQTDADYDKHKQDSLSKQKRGEGHWKRELASDSEEAVRADRASDENVADLQERTKKTAEELSKAGTSNSKGGL
ncbi:hypothetical protein AAL_05034 [Moelleriella libera RCEF 2490]|uniref:Mitochondrial carrier protein PET8 n=1 Tax=Moelleriella libera RCEF 2490 TaxID=1081109 RepID=A0A162IKW8_9HYPO|nr:hypothetical protein AAL_05034 [Moelleriella libera RCEF 2490]